LTETAQKSGDSSAASRGEGKAAKQAAGKGLQGLVLLIGILVFKGARAKSASAVNRGDLNILAR
jgi:hypothetical protein